ncbi:Probable cation-transporting ATPase 13A4 [Seminavis robusta]|uniref:Probable cation-transporting ATPase 13A4 n=1 Tax=Seminavis robusta TaxID=568900 RepID=A0A9N8DT65_9STRA|nr:Probable cation-transporting ATPase 13A4 [Seminavis robusta]|eukprot:Sro338_g120830.1 Probable cation-transporting ATPase 13A4 (1673) ;mRNA; f:33126-38623
MRKHRIQKDLIKSWKTLSFLSCFLLQLLSWRSNSLVQATSSSGAAIYTTSTDTHRLIQGTVYKSEWPTTSTSRNPGANKRVDSPTLPLQLRLRGGSTSQAPSNDDDQKKKDPPTRAKPNKKKVKSTKKKTTKKVNKQVPAMFQLIPVPNNSIHVEALLVDRYLSWKWLARIVLTAITVWQLQACQNTAGIPKRKAIWSILADANLLLKQDGTTSTTTTSMPESFQPTALDSLLAKTLARASRDMIPPAAMPFAGPLIRTIMAALALLVFTVLLPHWFLQVRVWYDYQQQPIHQYDDNNQMSPTAVLIRIDTTTSARAQSSHSQTICPLHRTNLRSQMEHNLPPFHFDYQHRRYYYDPSSNNNQCWQGGPNWELQSVGDIVSSATKSNNKYVGVLQAPSQLLHAQERWYPYNHQTSVPIPTLKQALWERIQSPLVVAQLIGKAMTVLEEGKAALVSLGTTLLQHYSNARASIQSSKRLQQDVAGLAQEFSQTPVWILRASRWQLLETSDLLPGDLFWISSANKNKKRNVVVPVDALLLEGVCVTMEAVLTGESVPQTKMPIDDNTSSHQWNQTLDMAGVHRNAILFAGTTVLHCSSSSSHSSPSAPPNLEQPGVLCLALRTGSYSSKGELIGALTSSRSKNNKAGSISNPQFDRDALKLISIMSVVTVLACSSLFWGTSTRHKVSGFRRIIQCSRIATTCIPSDLPMSLSHVVRSCAHVLRQEADVVCSQPGALLTASQIDLVVFDKTGTLTADTQALSQVITLPNATKSATDTKNKSKKGQNVTKSDNSLNEMANLVLAGCHSLVQVDGDESSDESNERSMVGDPLELAALRFSGWEYHEAGGYYQPASSSSTGKKTVEKLWQLKVFPFSPASRLSSAVCLVQNSNGEYKLWTLIKGAPEAVEPLIDQEKHSNISFASWYERKVLQLEAKGIRAIAMAGKELAIPDHLSNGTDASESGLLDRARSFADSIHRNDVEELKGSSSFLGLACFNAQTRPSSKRVLGELAAGNIHSVMLTGDSMAAALAVARKVGMLHEHAKLAALEVAPSSTTTAPELHFRITTTKQSQNKGKVTRLTSKVISDVLGGTKKGEIQLAASGAAIMALLSKKGQNQECDSLIESLSHFSVVARASPDCKEKFVASLSGRRVLMCGDGVNDVSAMKEAEVSVALLNGFGTESERPNKKEIDIEDNRRKQRLKAKRLAKQGLSNGSSALDAQGIGSSKTASSARIQTRIEEAQLEITKRAIQRQMDNGTLTSGQPAYSFGDLRDMLASIWEAGAEERRRAKKLKQGGGEAASILAEEDILIRQESTSDGNMTLQTADIKPGEACMASPFSCLRSSIDGVEAVIRAGIATAACALSVQQKITLHSLISCFNLSALFRDGFRYGMNMSFVDMILYTFLDFASYQESCKMRPRLPRSKRPSTQSLFAPANFFSVVGQVFVHLLSTEMGILFARKLEDESANDAAVPRVLIRAVGSQSPRVAAWTNAMAKSAASGYSDQQGKKNFLGMTKFVPNYETNVVFVLSIIQTIVTTLLMHKGDPFYLSILESQNLCFFAGLSGIVVVASILDSFPQLNQILELRPWKSKKAKFCVLGLALADTIACSGIEYMSRHIFQKTLSMKKPYQSTAPTKIRAAKTAANLEEDALREETRKNLRVLLICTIVMLTMTLGAAIG